MSNQKMVEFMARSLSNLAKYAVVLGVGGSAAAASLYNVDGGERAVLFDRFRGVLPEASDEGTHFLIPWVQTAHTMDIRIRPRLIPSATGTKDLQMVSNGGGTERKKQQNKNARARERERAKHITKTTLTLSVPRERTERELTRSVFLSLFLFSSSLPRFVSRFRLKSC